MCKLEHHQGSFSSLLSVCLLCFVYFLWVAPSGAETVSPATANLQASENLIVSTHDGLVSVMATEASLKDVIERIGQELGIDVEVQVGNNEKVIAEFQDLTLDQAMERLSGNYTYTTDGDRSRLEKLFVFPRGEAVQVSRGVAQASEIAVSCSVSSAERFEIEFDTADFIQQRQ